MDQIDKKMVRNYVDINDIKGTDQIRKLMFFLKDNIEAFGDTNKPENMSITEYWLSHYEI